MQNLKFNKCNETLSRRYVIPPAIMIWVADLRLETTALKEHTCCMFPALLKDTLKYTKSVRAPLLCPKQ
jgi:hypothetical protein